MGPVLPWPRQGLGFFFLNYSKPRWRYLLLMRKSLRSRINKEIDPPVGSGQEPLVLSASREMLGAKSAGPWTRNHLCRPCALETHADC